MLMMRTIKPLMSQRADSGGTCPLAILERRMAEHLRSRSLQPTPSHYQASSTMTWQLPKPFGPLPNPPWPLRSRYQTPFGHYQNITKPSLAHAITKHGVAITKPLSSPPWPLPIHYQAPWPLRSPPWPVRSHYQAQPSHSNRCCTRPTWGCKEVSGGHHELLDNVWTSRVRWHGLFTKPTLAVTKPSAFTVLHVVFHRNRPCARRACC